MHEIVLRFQKSPGFAQTLLRHATNELLDVRVNRDLGFFDKLRHAAERSAKNGMFTFTNGGSFKITGITVHEANAAKVDLFVATKSRNNVIPRFNEFKNALDYSAASINGSLTPRLRSFNGSEYEFSGHNTSLGLGLAHDILSWLKTDKIDIAAPGCPKVFVQNVGPFSHEDSIKGNPLMFDLHTNDSGLDHSHWAAINIQNICMHVAAFSTGDFVQSPKTGFHLIFSL